MNKIMRYQIIGTNIPKGIFHGVLRELQIETKVIMNAPRRKQRGI